MEKWIVTVQGMHCCSCSGRIEGAVGQMPGVARVGIDRLAKTMEVVFDPEVVQTTAIAAKVVDLGFVIVAGAMPSLGVESRPGS